MTNVVFKIVVNKSKDEQKELSDVYMLSFIDRLTPNELSKNGLNDGPIRRDSGRIILPYIFNDMNFSDLDFYSSSRRNKVLSDTHKILDKNISAYILGIFVINLNPLYFGLSYSSRICRVYAEAVKAMVWKVYKRMFATGDDIKFQKRLVYWIMDKYLRIYYSKGYGACRDKLRETTDDLFVERGEVRYFYAEFAYGGQCLSAVEKTNACRKARSDEEIRIASKVLDSIRDRDLKGSCPLMTIRGITAAGKERLSKALSKRGYNRKKREIQYMISVYLESIGMTMKEFFDYVKRRDGYLMLSKKCLMDCYTGMKKGFGVINRLTKDTVFNVFEMMDVWKVGWFRDGWDYCVSDNGQGYNIG